MPDLKWLAINKGNRVHLFDMNTHYAGNPEWLQGVCGHYAARHRLRQRNEVKCKKCVMELDRRARLDEDNT